MHDLISQNAGTLLTMVVVPIVLGLPAILQEIRKARREEPPADPVQQDLRELRDSIRRLHDRLDRVHDRLDRVLEVVAGR